ncbi:uncharacterized protein LOC142354578 [Convolutriloba macropyga]|uniref:uncharacterized protein LOC142354578 n=1 Tax=Convolutriloba macropyga TaxID=536237 RepID=UPI003F5264DB
MSADRSTVETGAIRIRLTIRTKDYQAVDNLGDIKPYVDYFTLVVVVLVSPLLIVTPFCIPKLRTLCRQAIAMIVLSDFVFTLSTATASVNRSHWDKAKNSTNPVCATVTFLENTSYTWSLCWSFVLLCCVLLNLHTTSVNKQKLFYILNVITWPSGALITLILYARSDLFPVTYNKTYIFREYSVSFYLPILRVPDPVLPILGVPGGQWVAESS